jgi:hypothetical protein
MSVLCGLSGSFSYCTPDAVCPRKSSLGKINFFFQLLLSCLSLPKEEQSSKGKISLSHTYTHVCVGESARSLPLSPFLPLSPSFFLLSHTDPLTSPSHSLSHSHSHSQQARSKGNSRPAGLAGLLSLLSVCVFVCVCVREREREREREWRERERDRAYMH